MMLKALIVEQLEADGTIKTFRMIPNSGEIVVALAGEYDSERTGPFHFLDEGDADKFDNGFANSTTRKLGKSRFRQDGEMFYVEFGWEGIPAGSGAFSCYALSFPEDAKLLDVKFEVDSQHREQLKCQRHKDSNRKREVIYVKLMSASKLPVGFRLKCTYRLVGCHIDQLEMPFSRTEHIEPLENIYPERKLKDFVEEGGKWVWENIKTIPADFVAEIFKMAF